MAEPGVVRNPSLTALRTASEAHEAAAVVLQVRHPRAARRQREAAAAARARLLRASVPLR